MSAELLEVDTLTENSSATSLSNFRVNVALPAFSATLTSSIVIVALSSLRIVTVAISSTTTLLWLTSLMLTLNTSSLSTNESLIIGILTVFCSPELPEKVTTRESSAV